MPRVLNATKEKGNLPDQRWMMKVSTSIILLSTLHSTKIVIYSTKLNPKSNAKC